MGIVFKGEGQPKLRRLLGRVFEGDGKECLAIEGVSS